MEGILAFLPLRFQALLGLSKGFLSRLQLRFHRFIKLVQLNVFVPELVDAADIFGELSGLVNGVYVGQNVSSITKSQMQEVKSFLALSP